MDVLLDRYIDLVAYEPVTLWRAAASEGVREMTPEQAVRPNRGEIGIDRPGTGTGTAQDEGGLAALLAQTARSLDAAAGPDETLTALVRAAVEVIPGAESVGITHVRIVERAVDVRYASDQFMADVDHAQQITGQGPCLETADERQPMLQVADFALEERWPRFTARARELGAGSMLSLLLYVEGTSLAALNVYSRRARAFDEESQQVALLFATHAAISLASARQVQDLHRALYNRDVIGQAKGMLMERFKINADQAFQVLAKASSQTNVKLHQVAERFVGTGDMPSR